VVETEQIEEVLRAGRDQEPGLVANVVDGEPVRADHEAPRGRRQLNDARGIADDGRGPSIAWFKDPSGNIVSVLQMPS
jgi:hypothetical protein